MFSSKLRTILQGMYLDKINKKQIIMKKQKTEKKKKKEERSDVN